MGKYKDTPRYNVISMRVSDGERKELQHIASRNAISISDIMRQAMDVYSRNHGSTAGRQQGAR
jgi:predicted transcriptional regulator